MSSGGTGGGGGGGSAPKVTVPGDVWKNIGAADNVASLTAGTFPGIASLINWAGDIATGGNFDQPNSFSYGPNTPFSTLLGNSPTVKTFPGFGNPGTTGGTNEVTTVTGGATAPRQSTPPATQMVSFQDSNQQTLSILGSPVDFKGQSFQPIYDANSQKFIGWMTPNGSAVQAASTQGLAPMMFSGEGGGGGGGTTGGSAGGAGGGPPTNTDQLLGPFLSSAWNAVGQIPALMGETGAFTQNAEKSASDLAAQSDVLMGQAQPLLSGKLTPDQQAYVDQATKSEQAAVASQLGAEGLASSTAAPILAGEVAQQGAATAGALEQGNIQLGQTQEQIAQQEMNLSQAASKLALGGQELSLGEQAALEQESAGLQSQMWSEAMQGYSVLGQMIQTVLASFGMSLEGLKLPVQASIADSQAAAAIDEANIKAASSSGSSAGGGLGSLFGMLGGGGGGGGLFGGIGSLIGGGAGAAAGVGGATGGIGAAGGIAALAGGLAAF